MISSNRVFTIVRKDLLWALYNFKLLGIMVLPLFMVLFFSNLDSEATFGFSLTFVNAFVGLFSTSYLIIEEKNKGTLLALLTTPLTGTELLLGKFLFNLVLCLSFSIVSMIINHRLDILLNPLVFLNLFLFAGTTCFVGYTMGVFFRNEQEMSVIAPLLMMLFIFGGPAEKMSTSLNVHAFFPDYHLAQVIRAQGVSLSDFIFHSFFNGLYFVTAFTMAAVYTGFYFSNNRERRLSGRLFLNLFSFVILCVGSGFYINKTKKMESLPEADHRIESEYFKVRYGFDKAAYHRKILVEGKTKTVLLFSSIAEPKNSIVLSIRKLSQDEKNLKERKNKVLKDSSRLVLSRNEEDDKGWSRTRWIYSQRDRFIVLQEILCGPEIFQWSLDTRLNQMNSFEVHYKAYQAFSKSLKWECLKK